MRKIGELVTIKKDITLKTFSGFGLKAKTGDKGIVTKNGDVYLITGEAQNKFITTDIQVKGIDCNSIAGLIFRRLDMELNLGEMLEDYDIENKDFIEYIGSMLEDIF